MTFRSRPSIPSGYPHSTEDAWRQRIQAGQVFLNGRVSSPDETLSAGDLLVYHRPPWEEPDVPGDFSILHEDKSVLVLSKPSGLPVLPGGGFLENTLLRLARRRFGNECSPLHRLGRGTSGAILSHSERPGRSGLDRGDGRAENPENLSGLGLRTCSAGRLYGRRPYRARSLSAADDDSCLSPRRPSVDQPCPGDPTASRRERDAPGSDDSHRTTPSN